MTVRDGWEGPHHADWEDAAGAYVLGALASTEAAAYETHLRECAACRAEVAELVPAVAALPASVPPRPAPAALRDRIMADVNREAQLLHAAGPEADRPAGARDRVRERRRFGWAPRWAVPAFVVAALAIGFAVGDIVSHPSARTVQLAATGAASGAHARLTIEDGHATLAADHLPQPPAGRVYQVWLKPRDGKAQPTSSLFVPRADGTAEVAVPASAAGMDLVMVNTEPPGGSPSPTTTPVLTAKMQS
jgi:anti-sigma-K factor RskA